MAFLTFDEVSRLQKSGRLANQLTRDGVGRKVFLSHSSKDDVYVAGVTEFLARHGAKVYSDNGDMRLPEMPSPETAEVLRKELLKADRLVIMVSQNSARSGWIPWELGMGDGHKGIENVALLPMNSTSAEEAWASREYLGIYPIIRRFKRSSQPEPEWVVDPNPRTDAKMKLLTAWLS